MKHSSTRDLYGYWQTRRAQRAAPERAEIDPTAIPSVLADTFLLGTDPSGERVFRLAGTRVCALFRRELKGEVLLPLFRREDQPAIRDLLDVCGEDAIPAVAGLIADGAEGATADLELLLLPLRHRGRTDTRILGVLVPVTRPNWLGLQPIGALTLGTFRYLTGPAPARRQSRMPILGAVIGRMRHGLVVYDGGRA